MSDFTVTVQNQSGSPKNFFVFAKAPEISGASNISQCVYAHRRCDPDQTIEFRIKAGTYYAVSCMKNGDNVSVSQSRRVTLGESVVSFEENGGSGGARGGSFVITTRDGGDTIGLGAEGDNGRVVPLAVFPAEEQRRYNISPRNAYYVAASEVRTGTVIDALEYEKDSVEVTSGIRLVHDGRLHK